MTPARATGPLLLAAMGAVMGAGLAARGDERPAPSRRVTAPGLSWRLPAGWHAAGRAMGLSDPGQALAAATFPVRARGGCSPRRPPARGVLVLLLESHWAAGVPSRLRRFPARPSRFRLSRRAQPLECFGIARTVTFREDRRAFQALVLAGGRAGARRLREAERMLDSLQVEPIPPPERPVWDAWRLLTTESGDSMRIPPGWRAHVLAVPRRHARPRLLFRAATSGVALLVVERRPGPISRRYPSLRTDPFSRRAGFSLERGRWRAGGAWRGYRFEVTIASAPGAAAGAVDHAFAAARSLGLSGGHRECGHACAGAR